jgi:hypothetical protein
MLRQTGSAWTSRLPTYIVLTAILAIVAFLAGAVGSGSAASTNKTLNCTTVTPQPATAGSSVTFTLHLCNDPTSPNQLGSASIAAPAGFSITSVTPPAGASWNSTTNVLTNLAIAPGSTKDVIIQATTPSLCADPGNLSWVIYAKQSNDFNGQPGNNFFPYPKLVAQHISGSCKLAFVNAPGETAGTTAVRTTKWGSIQSSGDPIEVKVVSGGGDVASATGTVSIKAVGTGCSVGGTTSASFSGGIATFSSLVMGNVASAASCQLQAYGSTAGYLDSDASSSFTVDPSNLYFATEPTKTKVGTAIRDVDYGSTATPDPAGNPINVGVQTTDGTSLQQFNGTGSVSVGISGAGCAMSGASGSFDPNTGVASFGSLTPTSVANGCALSAASTTSPTYNSGSSDPFDVTPDGVYCLGLPICQLSTPLSNSQVNTTGSGGNFTYIAISGITIDPSKTAGGCANFIGTKAGDFEETDGRNGDGTLDFVYYIKDKDLKQAYGQNYGQPNVPICAGTKYLVGNTPVACNDPNYPNQQGWADRTLGTDGKFNGYYVAQCAPDGFWYGILGTKQDPNPPFDSNAVPLITGWGTTPDGVYRTFNLHVPAGIDVKFGG